MTTITRLKTLALLGMASIGGVLGTSDTARAQGYGGVSIQVRSGGYGSGYDRDGCAPSPYGRYYGGRSAGYGTSPTGYNPNLPWSPAQQQGYREGRAYYESGYAPNHRLSPAEAQGFAAGANRQAQTPWQLDPAKQQGYREGRYFFETGILPRRPLSPAERQGFEAAQRQRSGGGYHPW